MMMKPIEKQKTELIIDRIEGGNFDLNDIDNLFMKLRGFSGTRKVFKDITHFVAHNTERDTGLAKDGMEAIYLRMKFFALYQTVKNIDFRQPFPIWIKRTLKFQLELLDEETLKKELDKNKNQVKNILDRSFRDNHKAGTTMIKKYNEEIYQVIKVLLGWIIVKPVYTGKQFYEELLKVLNENKIRYSTSGMHLQKEKILISVLLLFHNTRFLLKDGRHGVCILKTDKEEGTLGCYGGVPFDYPGKKYLLIGFPIFSTKLKAEDWLDVPLTPDNIKGDLFISKILRLRFLKFSCY